MLMAGCAEIPRQQGSATLDTINRELDQAAQNRKAAPPSDAVSRALLPPLNGYAKTRHPF
jgi:hypothetical protein